MRLELDLAISRGAFHLRASGDFALSGVSAVFGPNGAGKSTMLQAIAGFQPHAGLVRCDGAVWQSGDGGEALAPHRRPVAMVFQDGRLFSHLSVRGNLDFAARRADPAGPPIRLDQVIEWLELEPLLTRAPRTLSGGEAQRAAIGRALASRPRLLLMDEPLSALDRARKAEILGFIGELPEKFGVPVIFVSHIIAEVAQIADRLITVRAGRIDGEGLAAEMLEQLDVAMTGRFEAGALIEGEVVEIDEAYALSIIDIGVARLYAPGARHISVGDRVRLRLRARDVSIALQPLVGVSIRNQIPAVVTVIDAEKGAHAEVSLESGGRVLFARLTRQAVDELGLRPGLEVVALIKSVAFDRRFS